MSEAIEEFKGERNDLATVETSSTRAMAEVQAAMVIAKRFPRDRTAAFASIIESCKRPLFAEISMYRYPRGGSTIQGPSIRLAEVMAQSWGNMDFGIVELEQRSGESTMMAYAWDLETNTRRTMVFTVAHSRKARGAIVRLTDPRDIYEMNANMGARRLRSCILAIIPRDVQDAAVKQVADTIAKGDGSTPLIDRVRRLVVAFADISVTKGQLEEHLGHTLETTTPEEFSDLRGIYQSVRDNMSKPSDWFTPDVRKSTNLDELTDQMKSKKKGKKSKKGDAPTPEEMAEDEKQMALK